MNKYCTREAHASRAPFELARSVPPNSYKSVMDAWNGYHSVPIREEDRHLTTFATQWGPFRYCRAPQGYLSSGDGFNKRMDEIFSHTQRLERCVDDNLLHDLSIEEHWWRVLDFLEMAGNAGLVINPEKFQFGELIVDFAGFRIGSHSVEPLPKYLDCIRNFPTPTNISDIRSWFGLVNQVSHYAQLRPLMEPFRKFLSPKTTFFWNESLQTAFDNSKEKIVDAIKEGVQIYDVSLPTCLVTDWSKNGIGYHLSQKHCQCSPTQFGCCENGWRVTLAGSRFLDAAEQNYAPIEGEALGVAWALEQTRFFTLGCPSLLVVTDHQPLLKIFGDRHLNEIHTPRLFRLKRRTMMWQFKIFYVPGRKNAFADALSRNPDGILEPEDASKEEYLMAGISNEYDHFFAITWDKVQTASQDDETLKLLAQMIDEGFPTTKSCMPSTIVDF